ncbi:MAG: hypothetical protein AAF198_00370 [Pseudomonadota bacterium]
MSRKDPRKSIEVCPDPTIWAGLKRQARGSLSDQVRRLVSTADWSSIEPSKNASRGTFLSVQLPKDQNAALIKAAQKRNLDEAALLLGAVRQGLSK